MRASIAFTRRLSPAYRHLGLSAPAFSRGFRPGQFVMVRPLGVADPFLPRAFSIYRIAADGTEPQVEILYKVFGKGTQSLAAMEPGQAVELLGPLGNGFAPPTPGETAVLVAGGIGVPPIAALARALAQREGSEVRGPRSKVQGQGSGTESPSTVHGPSSMVVFLGGKTAEDILCLKDFEEAGARVQVTTEDGSLGTRGLLTDLLAPFLAFSAGIANPAIGPSGDRERPDRQSARAPDRPPSIRLYTCGPPGMLSAVARLAEQHGIPCQVSVEANMACGFGACMGCAVEVRAPERRYQLVCTDGPVFDARELVWK